MEPLRSNLWEQLYVSSDTNLDRSHAGRRRPPRPPVNLKPKKKQTDNKQINKKSGERFPIPKVAPFLTRPHSGFAREGLLADARRPGVKPPYLGWGRAGLGWARTTSGPVGRSDVTQCVVEGRRRRRGGARHYLETQDFLLLLRPQSNIYLPTYERDAS